MLPRALAAALLLALLVPVVSAPQAEAKPAARSVTLSISTKKANVGTSVKVSGKVSRTPKRTKVVIQQYVKKKWRTVATTRTKNANGKFSTSVPVNAAAATMQLRAVVSKTAKRARATSKAVKVKVTTWTQLSSESGGWVDCGLRSDASLWCWGLYVGDGKHKVRLKPVQVKGSWRQVDVGLFGVCAVKTDRSAWCWGEEFTLGDGKDHDGATATKPQRVAGGGKWNSVTVGANHACGIKTDGSAWCWGYRGNQIHETCDTSFNPLGDGPWRPFAGEFPQDGSLDGCGGTHALPSGRSPVKVAGTGTWRSISAGSSHTCGVKTDGTGWCWGANGESGTTTGEPQESRGLLGTGGTKPAAQPAPVSGKRTWKQIVAADQHTCGIATTGRAWCWGNNSSGQLGDKTKKARLVPTAVASTASWRELSVNGTATCAIRKDRTAWCWGANLFGQLGDDTGWGTHNPDDEKVKLRTKPVRVKGDGKWLTIATPGGLGLKTDRTLWRWGAIDTKISIGDGEWGGSYYIRAVPEPWAV